MKDFNSATKLAKKYSEKMKKENNVVSVVQIGSSLRKEDFRPDSDVDLVVVYENPVKNCIVHDYVDGFDIQILRYGKEQFLKCLEEGIPVNLVSLKFGEVLYDRVFFSELKRKVFHPTEKTIERWVRSSTFNLGDAAMNYSFPTCISEYYKSLQNAARGFCSILILKEKGIVVDGIRMILDNLDHPDLREKFKLVINGRKEGKELKRIVTHQKIKASGYGKYLLATEDIAIKVLKISMGLNVPKVNKLIGQLRKKYDIDHYHGFWLSPENKELMLHMVLKGDKSGFFRYSLETGKLLKADIPGRK